VGVTTEGATEHIEWLLHRSTGRPCSWYGGRDQVRVPMTTRAEKITTMG